MPELRLDAPLQYVKGVGPRKAEVLAQHGLIVVRDLLFYFPRQYLDRSSVTPIGRIQMNQTVTVIGRVRAHGVLYGRRKRYEVILEDETGAVALLWFAGVKYFEKLFKKDQIFAATGTVSVFQGMQMVHPDLERLEDDSDQMIHAGRIIPVYPQTAELNKVGLTSKGMRRVTSFVFEHLVEQVGDPIPSEETQRLGLPPLHEAIRNAHFPTRHEEIERSRRRLAFDELLAFQYLVMTNRKRRETAVKAHRYGPPGAMMKGFKERLPWRFTSGQSRATSEIFRDLQAEKPMARLLQGDVGCGKTVVAVAAALYVAENGLQSAFMAPTEILAEQHYRTWGPLLNELSAETGLLTSSLKAKTKKAVAEACAEGRTSILFGTHALIYDYVHFAKLGLVIIDEQHRFGVQQRGKLQAKGQDPDLLAMTATPIPRTLALTLYGDLDISTVDTMPPGRKPVRTVWRTEDVADKVWLFVREEVGKGGQAFVIYPVIERSDKMELENVEDAYRELSAGYFAGLRVGMVHGRIKAAERDETLARFHAGELDVLMATTVIEVGIDNPRATLMVIEQAERFGLAQLHQLRGRIGRGDKPATLVALAHPPLSEAAQRRLEYFASTTDGFAIAEADLELRGPGELYGVRQSGLPELRTARLSVDRDLLEAARGLVGRLLADTEGLDSSRSQLYRYLQNAASSREVALGGG